MISSNLGWINRKGKVILPVFSPHLYFLPATEKWLISTEQKKRCRIYLLYIIVLPHWCIYCRKNLTLVNSLRYDENALTWQSVFFLQKDNFFIQKDNFSILTSHIIVQQILLFFGEKITYTTLLGPTGLLISEIFPSKPNFHLHKWEKILPTQPY